MVVAGGGMRANTETSRSSARARAATTRSITKKAGEKFEKIEKINEKEGETHFNSRTFQRKKIGQHLGKITKIESHHMSK